MGSKKTHEGVEKVYAAAKAWVDCALRRDDSLFTPGKSIWTAELLGELRECYLDNPDTSGRGFYEKLRDQLEGRNPEVYQLMTEVLYVHYLIIWPSGMRQDTKIGRIGDVLGWSGQQVTFTREVSSGLVTGIANIGSGRSRLLPFMVGYIIEFVDQWKELEQDEQRRLLHDAWAFKDFASQIKLQGDLFHKSPNSHISQREALLHLVHPDTFEGTVSIDHKNRIAGAGAFSHFITENTDDVDRKLWQIRRGLESELGRDFDFYDTDIEKRWEQGAPLPLSTNSNDDDSDSTDGKEKPDIQTLADEVYLDVEFLREIETLLGEKKQVIFQGPPGTGKTFVAQKLAACLAGSEERVRLVQFHPSYAYEDFVQGYRPTLKDGQASFELRDGPLIEMANLAKNNGHYDYFLIIDEINRGSVAKILGELYFLLEYREENVHLQYQRENDKPFSLPKNLYIIGTMNTADRNIALVDLALRRRFYFVEFSPDKDPIDGVLRSWLKTKAPDMTGIADVVDRANKELDDRHAAIGPSYFMKKDLDEKKARLIWEHSVLPYVEERLFGEDGVRDRFDFDKLWREAGNGGAEGNVDDANGEGQQDAGG